MAGYRRQNRVFRESNGQREPAAKRLWESQNDTAMSVERLCQAREQLRRQFMEYVENLATGNSADDDIDQVVSLREAIDALDHAIKGGWHEPSSGA